MLQHSRGATEMALERLAPPLPWIRAIVLQYLCLASIGLAGEYPHNSVILLHIYILYTLLLLSTKESQTVSWGVFTPRFLKPSGGPVFPILSPLKEKLLKKIKMTRFQ